MADRNLNESTDIFEPIPNSPIGTPGNTVHTNTHCHALVENPFAWTEEEAEEE
jgi:hypothetical protein